MDRNRERYHHRWYIKNRARVRAATRERYRTDANYRAAIHARGVAWYAAHRETVLTTQHERYTNDPEYRAKQLLQAKTSRTRRHDVYRARAKHRLENPTYREANRQRAARWRRANPDRARVAVAAWKTAHPEWIKERGRDYAQQRRARMLGLPSEPINVYEIAARDGWRCHICGKRVAKADVSIDHLIPVSAGGPNLKTNVALAHLRCNNRRGAGRIPAQLRFP